MLVGLFYELFIETLCVVAIPSNLANPLSTSRTKLRTLSSLVTSNSTAWKSARKPVSRRRAIVFCAEWRVRAETRIVRSLRCWVSDRTIPRPMPREEPVTRMIGEVMGSADGRGMGCLFGERGWGVGGVLYIYVLVSS